MVTSLLFRWHAHQGSSRRERAHLVEVRLVGDGAKDLARFYRRLSLPIADGAVAGAGRWGARNLGDVHWLRPELVAEIEYAGFTADGQLRQAAFKGLREDKPAAEVEAETPAPATHDLKQPEPSTVQPQPARTRGAAVVMGVTITHPDKTLWPDGGDDRPVAKLDLAR